MLGYATRLLSLLWSLLLMAGIAGVVLPAFHYLPALGETELSWQPWQWLWLSPEFVPSLRLSLITGGLATLFSLLVALGLLIWRYDSRWMRRIEQALAPVLAIPHAALAIGLLFLLSPSGWLMRLVSPELSGFYRPPNWITVQDEQGISLILALMMKETPYLIFAALPALKQLNARAHLRVGRSLGYTPATTWYKIIIPQLYPIVRLPLFVVMAFNLTVVELSIVIGPNTPSTLSVTLLRWFNDPSLQTRFQASAGALVLLLVVAVCCLLLEWGYRSWLAVSYRSRINGYRRTLGGQLIRALGWLYPCLVLLSILSLLVLVLWSTTRRWRFPDAMPTQWSLDAYTHSARLLSTLSWNSLTAATISTLLALLISLCILEHKRLSGSSKSVFDRIMYLPMLLPQVGFLFGLQWVLLISQLSGGWLAVVLLHLIYVLPYVYLMLHGPYLAFDQRYYTQALTLCRKPWQAYVRVKLGMLSPALGSAAAMGISVSFALYLPTLIAGEGRITTLTTEAVTLASSGERKLTSAMALLQALFPLLAFWFAHRAYRPAKTSVSHASTD